MTTTADEPETAPAAPAPADVAGAGAGVELHHRVGGPVVTVLGAPSRRTASVLSCRLHEAIASAAAGAVLVVDLGVASAADPAVERVLVCARESAVDRGLGFAVR